MLSWRRGPGVKYAERNRLCARRRSLCTFILRARHRRRGGTVAVGTAHNTRRARFNVPVHDDDGATTVCYRRTRVLAHCTVTTWVGKREFGRTWVGKSILVLRLTLLRSVCGKRSRPTAGFLFSSLILSVRPPSRALLPGD